MASKRRKAPKASNKPSEGRDPRDRCRYIGADDAVGVVIVDLADVPQPDAPGEPLIGIEIVRLGPDGGAHGGPGMSGYLGYAPMWKANWKGAKPDEYDTDDIHDSLSELCKDYGIPLDVVFDRMAIAMVRAQG